MRGHAPSETESKNNGREKDRSHGHLVEIVASFKLCEIDSLEGDLVYGQRSRTLSNSESMSEPAHRVVDIMASPVHVDCRV